MTDTFDKHGAQKRPKKRQCIVCGTWVDEEVFCPNCGAQVPMNSSEPIQKPDPRQIPEPIPASTSESHSGKTALIILAIVGGVVLVVLCIIILFFVLKPSKKDSGPEMQSSFLTETEDWRDAMSETEETMEETETDAEETETETEYIDADIDAVHNRNCTIYGLLFFTDQMDDPIMVLDEPISIYVNSTSGEPVYYKTVTQIVFGSCSIREKKLKRYNNVEVEVTGSLWAENDFVYIDVQELLGDLPETETEETERETETDSDYILPESNSRYLIDADVVGLSLQEINYAKNEIYARHGRKFDSLELQNYFNSREWYKGTVDPNDFSTNVFNSYERENVRFLLQKEESMQKGGYKLDQ